MYGWSKHVKTPLTSVENPFKTTVEMDYPLVINIAMENGPFIDGLPIKNGGSFHGYVK